MKVEYSFFNGLDGFSSKYSIENGKLTITVESPFTKKKASKEIALDEDLQREISFIVDELAFLSLDSGFKENPMVMDAGVFVTGRTYDGRSFETTNFSARKVVGKINRIINERYPELEDEIVDLYNLLKGETLNIDNVFKREEVRKPIVRDKLREMYPQFYDESGVIKESAARFIDSLVKEHYLKEIESFSEKNDNSKAM